MEYKRGLYEHEAEGAVENENVNLLWDMTVQCDNIIEARRQDIVLVDKKESCMAAGIAVPGDGRVHEKELEKGENYQELRREVSRMWQLKKVHVVPVLKGTPGSVTEDFDKWMEKLGITGDFGAVQKTALLGAARILRKVLEVQELSVQLVLGHLL